MKNFSLDLNPPADDFCNKICHKRSCSRTESERGGHGNSDGRE
jgi:hypothetical protein